MLKWKKIEDDKKKSGHKKKITIKGPKLLEISNTNGVTLTFEGFTKLPPLVNSKAEPYPIKSKCEITGLPAKYLDPKTGLPYATLEAFKIIRERYDKMQAEQQAVNMELESEEKEKEENEGEGGSKKKSKKKKKKKKKGSESEDDVEEVVAPRRRQSGRRGRKLEEDEDEEKR